MNTKLLIISGLWVFFSGLATAQHCAPPYGKHGYHQRERIREGWHSGDLSRREMRELRQQQRHIHMAKRRMLRDGYIDPQERRQLKRMKKQADRNIWKEKHDRERRCW